MKIIILCLLSIFTFAIEIQKPQSYQGDENINSWLMSEKLDGIRAYWDGKEFFTRKGKKIYAPSWFTKNFPDFELDGELWTKRDDFENIQSIVMDKTPSLEWKQITYNIFEVPNAKADFIKRLEKANKWFIKNKNNHVQIIKQEKVVNKENLNKYLEEIINKKGEGVIIKDPSKQYHTGRSPFILKVKKAKDMEGVVIGINISQKTKVLKSLAIKLEDGITFNLGTGFTDKQRKYPPKIGDIVTFKYYGFTKNGKPKFASFLHIRKD
ncbi:DNA ligase [Halarcobacter sp.]|uniref:DNA ligase n=1 Tax=Halarcobacter sp. TaxID=2321133 RepID=UPI002AAB2A5F|nr:DNA ligase [Halarcobacter sp.]